MEGTAIRFQSLLKRVITMPAYSTRDERHEYWMRTYVEKHGRLLRDS